MVIENIFSYRYYFSAENECAKHDDPDACLNHTDHPPYICGFSTYCYAGVCSLVIISTTTTANVTPPRRRHSTRTTSLHASSWRGAPFAVQGLGVPPDEVRVTRARWWSTTNGTYIRTLFRLQ